MGKKIRILVVPSDTYGVFKFRCDIPTKSLLKYYPDDFDAVIDMKPDWNDVDGLAEKYDIIHFHKGVYKDMEKFWKNLEALKARGVKLVMDVDDAYWHIDKTHPSYYANVRNNIPEKVKKTLGMVDWVTTTTPIFAKEIMKYNKNVFVSPNGIDPDIEQFQSKKEPSKNGKIRFGFIMGSSHEPDMEIMRGTFNKIINSDVVDKVEFHLCGYDLRGTTTVYNQDGSVTQRPIKPDETVWHRFELMVTDNYNPKVVSPEYKNFLRMNIQNLEYPGVEKEGYVRQWTRDVDHYCTHYNTVDVLLVPLRESIFNSCKSQLKLLEAGFMDTAVVCSNFGPYTIDTIPLIEKGGTINPEGNAILIDEAKNHKDWAKAIIRLAKNPELITTLKENLAKTIRPKYNMETLSGERAEFYKSIISS
jgi:glycosyltransferase involved in cell wall biosynthesis